MCIFYIHFRYLFDMLFILYNDNRCSILGLSGFCICCITKVNMIFGAKKQNTFLS